MPKVVLTTVLTVAATVLLLYVAPLLGIVALVFMANALVIALLATRRSVTSLVVGMVVLALIAVSTVVVSPVLLLVAVGEFTLICSLGAGLWWQLRRRRALIVLEYLEQAVRLNLPLPAAMEAAAMSEHGAAADRLIDLYSALLGGVDLQTALAQAVPETPRHVLAMVGVYERLGRLPRLFERIGHRYEQGDRTGSKLWNQSWWYMLGVLPAVVLVLVLTMIAQAVFLLPMFEEILEDFDTPTPPMTQVLLNVSAFDGGAAGMIFLGGFWIMLLIAFSLLTRSGRATLGHLAWRTPVLHGLLRDRGLAEVSAVLEEGALAGQPLHASLNMAGDLRINRVLRRRVEQWADRVESGEPAADAARDANMPELVSGMIGSATTTGDMIDALRFLSRHYQSKVHRLATLIRAAAAPVVVVLLGVPVAVICLGIMQPLVFIIKAAAINSGTY